jgi:hypothetical protein
MTNIQLSAYSASTQTWGYTTETVLAWLLLVVLVAGVGTAHLWVPQVRLYVYMYAGCQHNQYPSCC